MEHQVRFFVTRHGQTLLNTLDKAQGWADSPLTAQGAQAASRLGRGLFAAGVPFSAAYASDSGRALETARLVLEPLGPAAPALEADPRLREWCLGSLEAEPNPVLMKALRENVSADIGRGFAWLNLHMDEVAQVVYRLDKTGMAQPFEDIRARLTGFLDEAARRAGGGNVLVVTHAFVIKTLLFLFAPDRVNEKAKIENASITMVVWEDGALRVEEISDTHYSA
ncbi:phosphoglycerate mutase [Oscillospiraceae bacterium]|nr:phosphoglycerate mutase [Oscillospiraceae bacterium]BDF74623.1 phosphoglycerate mutase [Oscillospiraceae bacterium]